MGVALTNALLTMHVTPYNGAIGQEKGRTMDDTRIETGDITNKEILR